MKPPSGPKKTNPSKPNFKPGDGFSAYYTRDCHVAEFTLSAAEGDLEMAFWGAFLQRVAARPYEKRWHYELIGDKIV